MPSFANRMPGSAMPASAPDSALEPSGGGDPEAVIVEIDSIEGVCAHDRDAIKKFTPAKRNVQIRKVTYALSDLNIGHLHPNHLHQGITVTLHFIDTTSGGAEKRRDEVDII